MAKPTALGPNLSAIVGDLVGDLAEFDDEDPNVRRQAELDAIATLTGLTKEDLVSLCLVLTKRLITAERHSGPGTYDDPTPDEDGRIDEGGEG